MATGQTVKKWTRVYVNGYDMSGYTRSIGELQWEFDEAELTTLSDGVKGYMANQGNVSVGALNGVMDDTAVSGLHTVAAGLPGTPATVMVAQGIRAEPANGDPMFTGYCEIKNYKAEEDGGAAVVTMEFDQFSTTGLINYARPWGFIAHAKGAETAANTAVGIDDNGAASALGGYMVYQVFAGDGTATLKIQDAATNTNPSFADLSGCTTGSIDCSSVKHGLVAIGVTATVRQYIRWQIVLGTATTVTFALGFVRGQ